MPALGMSPTITHRVNTAHPGGTLGCHCLWQCLHHMHTHTETKTATAIASMKMSQQFSRPAADIDLGCGNLIIKIEPVSQTTRHARCVWVLCLLSDLN